jgi:hypothetical protein
MNTTGTIYQHVLDRDVQGVEIGVNQTIQEGLAPETIF